MGMWYRPREYFARFWKEEDTLEVVLCRDCKHNNACLTQAFVEEASRVPFDRSTFFCADGKRVDDA